ncbi:MAG: cation:proton antiporter [Methanomassiliicoccales archaeon]
MIDLEIILVELFVLVLLANMATVLCRRFEVPVIVGVVLVGILLSNITLDGQSLFSMLKLSEEENRAVFDVFAELGVIFLLFTVGLETPLHELRRVGRTAALVAVLGVIVPFFVGLALMLILQHSVLEALFVGAAMVATSVGITAYVLKDLGMMETIEAKVILGAAVIDDVLGLIVLSMVSGIAIGGSLNIIDIAVVAALAVAFVLLIMFITAMVPKARSRLNQRPESHRKGLHKHISPLPFALVVCFGLSALASYLNLAAIVGAFLAGMLFAELRDIWPAEEKFNPINEFLVPFFFLQIGFLVNLSAISTMETIFLVVVVTILAALTKFAGAFLGSLKLGKGSANIIGVGMIPRGEVGIIVASIGLMAGVLSESLYAVVVFMSLLTTIMTPSLLGWAVKRKMRHKHFGTAEAKL